MTKLFRLLLLAGLLLGWQRPGAAQVFEWAKMARKLTLNSFTNTPSSVTDAAGNTYSSLQFGGQLQVGTQTLTAPLALSTALIKYTPSGQVTWAKLLTGIGLEELALDPVTGGVYFSGRVQSGASWDGSPVTAAGPYFYGKATATGTLLWTNSLPSLYASLYRGGYAANDFIAGLNLAVDGPGNVYLMGCLQNPGTVGGTALDNQTMFLLQTDGNGATQWVRQLHDNTANSRSGLLNPQLTAKPGGGCLITARFVRTLYFGAGTTGPSIPKVGTGQDGLLASIDAAGNLQWGRAVTGTSAYIRIEDAAVDAAGNCYVTGSSTGGTSVGSTYLPTGFLLLKYDAAGNLVWGQGQQTNTGRIGGMGMDMTTNAAGTAISVAVFDSAAFYLAPPVQIGTLSMPALSNVVRFDGQGQPLWAVGETRPAAPGSGPYPFVRTADLGTDSNDNLYWSGDISTRLQLASLTVATQLGAQTVVGDGIILTRLQNQSNSLVGEVYQDLNANGQRDAGEPAFAGPAAQVTQNGVDMLYPIRTTGQLQAFATPGSYSLTLAAGSLPRYHTITQPAGGSYSGSFSGSNQVQSGKVFGLSPLANQADVRVTLTPYGVARVGTLLRYRVTVENTGTTTAAGTLTSVLDSRAQYVGSTPAGTVTGNTISWNYANLAPQATQTFDVQYSLPVNLAVGTVLTYTATATLPGELTPADNSVTEQQTVVGSLDPNDISVNYTQLTEQQVLARQPLDYTVRFQNMGTDTAFAVVIQDTLDVTRLQAATLEMLAQSHNCSWLLSRQGTLTLRLLNAKLPPRSTNVLASQGFIRFRVRPLSTLTPGTVIPNHAHITFDYNAPLRTNTATTTVMQPLATRPGQVALSWDAYPNPTTDALTISLPANTTATAELLDALGRPVRQQALTGATSKLDLRTLPAGLYLLRLRTPQGYTTGRSIVRQ